MDETKIAELEAAAAAAKQAAEAAGGTDADLNKAQADAETAVTAATSSQDPLAQEIKRNKDKTQRSEADKAEFTLRKNAERAKELGLDPAKVLGFSPDATGADTTDDDSRAMTVGEYKRIQEDQATKTALELADTIQDPNERELTKQYLGRVKPSGDPQEDLRFARLAVNSLKNSQVVEELSRATQPKNFGSAPGAPSLQTQKEPELSNDELAYTRPPWNMTPAAIIATRPKS